jgi:transcription elongation GreA/GreB family factor
MARKLPIGIQSFEDLRRNDYLYVDKTELLYQLVTEGEANVAEGKLATTTPIAKGLLGKKVGDIAEVVVPAGKLQFKILEISL